MRPVVPTRLVADVFPIYCAVTVIRAEAGLRGGKYQLGLKAVSKKGRPGEARGGQGREPLLVTAMIKQVQGTPGLVHTFFLLPSFPFPFHSERIIPFDQSEVRILS